MDEGAQEIVLQRADKLMSDILYATDAKEYRAFLSGRDNFRYKVYPEYKANRKATPKPFHLQAVREFLINEWKCEVCNGYEADDALGIEQTELNKELCRCGHCGGDEASIICTIDKDLDMIPGMHYNFVKGTIYEVSEIEAIRFFYKQLLIGDTSDNITGIHGIGKVGAAKLIDHLDDEKEMYEVVKELYKDQRRLCTNMQCLWIWH